MTTLGCGTDSLAVTVEDSKGQEVTSSLHKTSDNFHYVSFTCLADQASFYVVMASVANEIIAGEHQSTVLIDVHINMDV